MKTLAAVMLVCACLPPALAVGAGPAMDRTQRPAVGPAPKVETPQIVKRTLQNGLPVWIVTRRELPVVSASLQIRVGSAMDDQRSGIADMTASLLEEGTASRSSLAFANALDFIGARLSASAEIEQTVVSLLTLTKHLDSALTLMGDMVVRPAFSSEEVERERKSRLQSLKQQRDLPAVIASQTFNRIVYGEQHPYGRPAAGTIAHVETITRDQIVEFYDRYYRPNNAFLIVVGDVSEADLVPRLERALAGWSPKPIPEAATTAPARPPDHPLGVYLIDKPNAAQSEIRIGHAGAARTTSSDYYRLQVMNALLGGQFTSRINLNLREARGYTYGARSSWSYRRGDGPFVASGGVFTAKTDSSLIEFLKELKDIRGPRAATAAETDAARNQLMRSYPRRLETNEGVAAVLGELAFYGLPESEITDFLTRIGQVTPEEVTQVADKYVSPEHLSIVVVGDLAKIRTGVEALGLGPIKVLDSDGKEISQ